MNHDALFWTGFVAALAGIACFQFLRRRARLVAVPAIVVAAIGVGMMAWRDWWWGIGMALALMFVLLVNWMTDKTYDSMDEASEAHQDATREDRREDRAVMQDMSRRSQNMREDL